MATLDQEVTRYQDQMLDWVLRECKRLSPVKTGRLKRSFYKRNNRVVAGAPYAKYVVKKNDWMLATSRRARRRIRMKVFRVRGRTYRGHELLVVRYRSMIPQIGIFKK